ncbi:MAG: leucine-rich repeat domain-containing protein [Bacteroidia bacterium]|nr:leucine-rich repeat domain-containing protein [Bacteroidia bacterium]
MNVPANMNLSIQTLNGTANFTLTPGQTLDLGDIQATGSNFIAAALMMWNDISQTSIMLQVFVNGGPNGLTFSVDSVSWQTIPFFTFPNSPGLNHKKAVWIRESDGCITKIYAYLRRRGAGCYLPPDVSVDSLPKYTSWISALQAYNQGATIYRYASCESLSLVLANFICLRELALSSCNLSEVPDGMQFLMGLQRLDLSNNPIDHIPPSVIGLPNLSLLDMRGTSVPIEDRAGYEQQMPGVTIYWDACDGPNNGWDWTLTAGGTSMDYPTRMASLDDGAHVVVGHVGPGTSIGNTTVDSASVFVAAFDRFGRLRWLRTLNANDIRDVTMLPDSSVCIVGTYFNDLDFGNGIALPGNQWQGGFVCRYDAQGNALWAKSFDGPEDDEIVAITKRPDGSEIAIAGAFRNFVVFNDDTLQAQGNQDLFWAKLSPNGELLYRGRLYGTGNVSAKTLEFGNDGTIILAGTFDDTLYLGNSTLSQGGAFVAKFGNDCNYIWHRRSDVVESSDVAVMNDGTIIVVGAFEGTVNWDNQTLTSNGPRDGFCLQYDSDGNLNFIKRWGGGGTDAIRALTVGNDSSIYLVGDFQQTLVFSGNHNSRGLSDAFIGKIDRYGNEIRCEVVGGTGDDFGLGIGMLENGTVGVVGSYEAMAQAGPNTLTSSGNSDIFRIKLCGD